MSELQRLRDRVEELEQILGMDEDDVSLIRQVTGLAHTPATMVSILYRRRVILTKETLHQAIYGGMAECDQPQVRVLDSLIHQARKALRPYDVNIHTVYGGGGFSMDELSRARFKALLTQRLEGMLERLEPQPRLA
jgi:ribosome biogenesis SPOUT family RNA methylase Rps3